MTGDSHADRDADALRVIADAELRAHGELDLHNTRLERCYVHNSSAVGGHASGVEVLDCTTWACRLSGVHLEDCVVRNLQTSRGGGGRTTPLFVWGGTVRRVVLSGTIGGVIWNPPQSDAADGGAGLSTLDSVRRFYDSIDDWALDVSSARFRSVPSFRFGPPGRLIRRDPDTQPLITKEAAARALQIVGDEIGVWRVVLRGLATTSWPEEMVLMPGLGGPKARRERELAGLARLRQIGAFENDP